MYSQRFCHAAKQAHVARRLVVSHIYPLMNIFIILQNQFTLLSLWLAVLGSKCFQVFVHAPEEREDCVVAQHLRVKMCQLGCDLANLSRMHQPL